MYYEAWHWHRREPRYCARLHLARVYECLQSHHHLVIVCAIFGVGNVCQGVAKVLSSPEPLELGLVPKACPHLFLISRLPVQILLFSEIHLSPDIGVIHLSIQRERLPVIEVHEKQIRFCLDYLMALLVGLHLKEASGYCLLASLFWGHEVVDSAHPLLPVCQAPTNKLLYE